MNARDLLPGEHMLASTSRHWIVLLRPVGVTILLVLVALAIVILVPITGELKLFFGLAAGLFGAIVINVYYWAWRAHEYVLTDQRVILNEGLLSKFSRSIAIDRIQDLTTFQGVWGRALRFGDIEVESAGRESAEVLNTVPHPQQLRNAIFAQMEARRSR
jgi:uncharacterized membrane protein YdbT with pleckstrin-like domain